MGSAPILLIADVLVAMGAAAITSLLHPPSSLDAAICFGIVVVAAVAVIELVAGALGLLEPGVVLALDAAWATGAVALAARRGVRRPTLRLGWPPGAVRRHPWESVVVAMAALALAWRLLVGLVLPPYAFDGLTYHLTIVAGWIQAKDLGVSPLSLCCSRYPANAELEFAWPALLLGRDALVDTVQVGFSLLGALAVAGLARTVGMTRAAAAAAGALFVVTPVVLAQVSTAYTDVEIVACVLVAIHLLLRFAVTGQARLLFLAGLASGFVLGTKGIGIVWAAALVVGGVGLVGWARRRGHLSRRRALGTAAGFLATTLLLGAWWYVRNWIDTGNPVYPFRIELGGVTLFSGPTRIRDVLTLPGGGRGNPWPVAVARSWAADLAFWHQGPYSYEERTGGLGPLWPWLGLPLLVPVSVGLVRRRSPALLFLGLLGVVFLVQPYRWWSRFTLDLAAAAALAVVCAVAWAPRRWLARAIRSAALALALAGVVLSSYAVDPAGAGHALGARGVLRLATAPARERTLGRVFFGEYRFLDHVPPGATLVVDLPAPAVRFTYPLFGAHLDRRVVPGSAGPPPRGAWIVTSAGRPLDRQARRRGLTLVSDRRDVRAYRPPP